MKTRLASMYLARERKRGFLEMSGRERRVKSRLRIGTRKKGKYTTGLLNMLKYRWL